jgi:hypothetical protein
MILALILAPLWVVPLHVWKAIKEIGNTRWLKNHNFKVTANECRGNHERDDKEIYQERLSVSA